MSKSEKAPEKYISIAGIKATFNITDRIIKLLGEPDLIVPNPHYKSAPEMKLFDREKITKKLEQLRKNAPGLFAKMKDRRAAAGRAVNTKKKHMENFVDTTILDNLKIQEYDAKNIPELAEKQHSWHEISIYGEIRHDWIGGFNAEIAYIRHNLTNYESLLDEIKGKVGASNAYTRIKQALNDKIVDDYKKRLEFTGIVK